MGRTSGAAEHRRPRDGGDASRVDGVTVLPGQGVLPTLSAGRGNLVVRTGQLV
jgi:hypothetical protein